jgi:hypothetical protein
MAAVYHNDWTLSQGYFQVGPPGCPSRNVLELTSKPARVLVSGQVMQPLPDVAGARPGPGTGPGKSRDLASGPRFGT